MARVNLNEIVAQQRQATREEKNILFRDWVCETTCPRVIRLLSEAELNRILALHLYDYHVLQLNRNRCMTLKSIGLALGVTKSTLYRWFPAKSEKQE